MRRIVFGLLLLGLAACQSAAPATPALSNETVATLIAVASAQPPTAAPLPPPTTVPTAPAPAVTIEIILPTVTGSAPTAVPAAPTLPPAPTAPPSAASNLPFAYGWNVAFYAAYQPASGQGQYPASSFNWFRIPNEPEKADYLCNQFRLPYNVLLRLNKAQAGVSPTDVASQAQTWAQSLHQPNGSARCVEAFEIGSQPNLAGAGRYNGPVNPEAYADQLCAAYDAIKTVDPDYVVVSGALAATGGDTPDYLDEAAFARRLVARIAALKGPGGRCFDAFGATAYGYRTGYATDPTDAANCPDGLCFRGVEQYPPILAAAQVNAPVWVTDFGWLRDPNAQCGGAGWVSAFAGFGVSDQAQADNLVGAFAYARTNWPWLGALFVTNLDYNHRPWSADACADADGWFAVKGYPAEAALETMPKP